MFGLFSPIYFLVRALTGRKSEDSLMERAYDLRKKGDFGRAIEIYSKAIETGTSTWVVYFYRGQCRQSAGDLQGAIADYQKAVEINPKYSDKAKKALAEARAALKK
jgi:tetratricopeptide (TPR) repeat protein